jgi:hypothetical protein
MPRGTLVHIHIPKAAGTTCHEFFKRQYASHAVFDTNGRRERADFTPITIDCGKASDFVMRVQSGNEPLILGHQPYGIHRKVGKARADAMLYFSVIRHPVYRVWSLYQMQKQHSVYKLYPYLQKHSGSFLKVLQETPPKELPECSNDQLRMIIGSEKFSFNEDDLKEAIRLLDEEYFYVTILDQLEQRKPEICKVFQFNKAAWPNTNIGRSKDSYYTEDPDDVLWNTILNKNLWDMALYEHVKARGGLVGKVLKELQQESETSSK